MARISSSDDVESYAKILGYKEVKFSFKYLEVPLGAKYKDQITWDPVIDLFEKKNLQGGREVSFLKNVYIL